MLLGLLLAAQIIVSLLLIGVVLLQRSEGGGLWGGGSPSGMMSVRGAGDLMTLFEVVHVQFPLMHSRRGAHRQ